MHVHSIKAEIVMAAKFELFKSKGGDFRFHLKAANGEIIASSQGYKSKAAADKGIESVGALRNQVEPDRPAPRLTSCRFRRPRWPVRACSVAGHVICGLLNVALAVF
jgi:uncharacterized protein YegP (UPF0339 family)